MVEILMNVTTPFRRKRIIAMRATELEIMPQRSF